MSTDSGLVERLILPIRKNGMPNSCLKSTFKIGKQNRLKCGLLRSAGFLPLLGGGLEPRFMVLFSAIFHDVSLGNCHKVENRGFSRKQNCCKLLHVYVHFICELY